MANLYLRNSNALIGFLTVVSFLMSCKGGQNEVMQTMSCTNTSDMELSEKAISIERNRIAQTDSLNPYPLLLNGNDTIPSQLNDLDGDGSWDELFFVANFSPNEKKMIELKWVSDAPNFPIRTSARFGKRAAKDQPVHPAIEEILPANEVHRALGYQRYQTDGPTWENDKVGFRHYLDGRNAKDIFGKKTAAITPEDVGIDSVGGVRDNYHVMHDWGRDIFPVGSSVGLGGFALLVNDKVERLGILGTDTLNNIETTTFKIVAEGAVNSVLSYNYENWKVSNGNIYQVKERTSIWPGMYGYKNTVKMEGLQDGDTLLVGLSNINNQKPMHVVESEQWICLIQHDSLTYDRQWIMGTALILPKQGYSGYMEAPKEGQLTNSYLAKLKIDNNQPFSYYAVAGWELSQDKNFKDSAYFTNYVTELAKQLAVEITVDVGN